MSYAADAELTNLPTAQQLTGIAALVKRQLTLETAVEAAQEELERLTRELRAVQCQQLPDAMAQAGVLTTTTTDGYTVTVKNTNESSISEENKPRAFDWLRGSGYGDLIKHKVTVWFSRGQEALARQLLEFVARLANDPLRSENDESVHYQTLKAFVNELLEKGLPISDAITVFPLTKAVITAPKRRSRTAI